LVFREGASHKFHDTGIKFHQTSRLRIAVRVRSPGQKEKYLQDRYADPDTGRKIARVNHQTESVVRMKKEIADSLRIVPQEIWNQVVSRREKTKKTMREGR
jgi:hypothetical protein